MTKLINELFDKDSAIRKKAIKNLYSKKLSQFSSGEIKKVYKQLILILENDSPEVTFFAKKLMPNIKSIAKIKKINLDENPIEDIYLKNSNDLVDLLCTPEKIARINAIYALAKNGCNQEHIKALELFAETATEDEATLAIDSIEAIKKFIKEKEEKEKIKLEKRKQNLKIFNSKSKKISSSPIVSTEPIKKKKKSFKLKKFNPIYIIILILFAVYHLYFNVIFNPINFLPDNSVFLEYTYSNFKPLIIYELDGKINYLKPTLNLSGWKIKKQ
jgi:Fe2+ transport system protein B